MKEKSSFDCLKGYGDSFSANVIIRHDRLGVEDGKFWRTISLIGRARRAEAGDSQEKRKLRSGGVNGNDRVAWLGNN